MIAQTLHVHALVAAIVGVVLIGGLAFWAGWRRGRDRDVLPSASRRSLVLAAVIFVSAVWPIEFPNAWWVSVLILVAGVLAWLSFSRAMR